MSNAWIGVIGALAGVLAGWGGNMIAQRQAYARESTERLTDVRRRAYLEWLTSVHHLYDVLAASQRALRAGEADADEVARTVRNLPTGETQVCLEELRFVAGDAVAARAADLWNHMRRQRVALGQDVSAAGWRTWRERYWGLRRAFIDAARMETGLEPLDWDAAGIAGGTRF